MIPLRQLQIKEKSTARIVLIKSFGLFLHEVLLFFFWLVLTMVTFMDESQLGMLEFYRKHLHAGLLLLPTKTKLLLVLPAMMAVSTLLMLGAKTSWEFDKSGQKVVRRSYFLFLFKGLKKEWAFTDIAGIRLVKENRRSPYVLELVSSSGKGHFIDHSRGEKKLEELAREIAILTGLKLFR